MINRDYYSMFVSFKPKIKSPRLNPSSFNSISGIFATYLETVLYNLLFLASMHFYMQGQLPVESLITIDLFPPNKKD